LRKEEPVSIPPPHPKIDDDTYLLDRWILLSDGNDVVDVSQVTDAPDGSVNAQKAVVQTVNEKFGFLQVIENANCQNIIDAVASLSFQAKTGTNAIRNIRAAVLSWSGAKDTVTSDVVSAWNAEGTDPTLAANWAYENIPVDIPLISSYQKFAIPDISMDTASAVNVAVFIWVDDTNAAVSDELFLGQVQLEKGSAVSDFEHRQIGDELILCQRYYERVDSSNALFVGVGYIQATNVAHIAYYMKVEKRATPIVTITGTASNFRIGHQATGTNASQVPTTALKGTTIFDVIVVVPSGSLITGQGCRLDISGDAVIGAISEL
jgi:hypothetical protein